MKNVDEIVATNGTTTIDEVVEGDLTDKDVAEIVDDVVAGSDVLVDVTETDVVPEIKEDGKNIKYKFILYDVNGAPIGIIDGHIKADHFKRTRDYVGRYVRDFLKSLEDDNFVWQEYPVFVDWEVSPGEIDRITIADYT